MLKIYDDYTKAREMLNKEFGENTYSNLKKYVNCFSKENYKNFEDFNKSIDFDNIDKIGKKNDIPLEIISIFKKLAVLTPKLVKTNENYCASRYKISQFINKSYDYYIIKMSEEYQKKKKKIP